MSPELAKELKDAGYPQHGRDVMTPHTSDVQLGRESVYYATLEELIEACGKQFAILTSDKKTRRWTAYSFPTAPPDGFAFEGEGSTPIEAVARLWLALNKK